ncbi:DUF2982 domain-containing protein [Alteromonas sediminis]|uniref:DUF2982 domain-containing protein n=1 Tax=Alteromonas sediminis TaxID=2259342 RepID=A0A3N5Y706_9ALTE|nr:DUF2982 domain-containing protein [Alteromonas sediminis]RPJ66389.1 DUF2982 domain-containing protein [Alteromonas sediminis]
MSGFDSQVIKVRANAKKNGITTLFVGVGIMLLSVVWLSLMPDYLTLPGFFLTSAAIVTLLIGWFKLREPEHSILITPEQIQYTHRLGKWQLAWSNIQRVGQPRVVHGIEHKDLEMIGLKINDYYDFISTISPRLATHLLMEQRPLLLQSMDKSCTTGMCSGNGFLEDTRFKLPSGKVLTGVQAMLANRMNQLRQGLGFDIYVSGTELDREPHQFVTLLKECQQSQAVLKRED